MPAPLPVYYIDGDLIEVTSIPSIASDDSVAIGVTSIPMERSDDSIAIGVTSIPQATSISEQAVTVADRIASGELSGVIDIAGVDFKKIIYKVKNVTHVKHIIRSKPKG